MAITRKITAFIPRPLMAHNSEMSMALSSLSAWKAFQAGMHILQRYAHHSPADIHAIATSNLRLLHQSLSCEAQYNNSIENIRYEGSKTGLPGSRRLYTDRRLIADVLTLQDGTSINLTTLPHCYAMYLLISGSAQLDTKNETGQSAQHWWERLGVNGHKRCLRNGAVIIRSGKQETDRLVTCGKNCLLLRINIPIMDVPGKTVP